MTDASRARVAGVKYSRSVHAPLHTRCRTGVSQSASVVVSWVGITLLPPLPFRLIITIPPDPSLPHLTSRTQACSRPVETATADPPRATAGRYSPISAHPHKTVTATSHASTHRINHQSSQVQVRRKFGDHRCFRRRDTKRRTPSAPRSFYPSTSLSRRPAFSIKLQHAHG